MTEAQRDFHFQTTYRDNSENFFDEILSYCGVVEGEIWHGTSRLAAGVEAAAAKVPSVRICNQNMTVVVITLRFSVCEKKLWMQRMIEWISKDFQAWKLCISGQEIAVINLVQS